MSVDDRVACADAQCDDAVMSCVAAYRQSMRRLANQPLLSRSFQRMDVQLLHGTVRGEVVTRDDHSRRDAGAHSNERPRAAAVHHPTEPLPSHRRQAAADLPHSSAIAADHIQITAFSDSQEIQELSEQLRDLFMAAGWDTGHTIANGTGHGIRILSGQANSPEVSKLQTAFHYARIPYYFYWKQLAPGQTNQALELQIGEPLPIDPR